MNSTARGLTRPEGREPALYASTRPTPCRRANASAIWLRLLFSTHTNSTRLAEHPAGSLMAKLPSLPWRNNAPHGGNGNSSGRRPLETRLCVALAALDGEHLDAGREIVGVVAGEQVRQSFVERFLRRAATRRG